MRLYRFADSLTDEHGLGSVARKRKIKTGYMGEPIADPRGRLLRAACYDISVPTADRQLDYKILQDEICCLDLRLLGEAATQVDGEEFLLDFLHTFDVPEERVRIGVQQCLVRYEDLLTGVF